MEPIVCTLSTGAAAAQLVDWHELGRLALKARQIRNGISVDFPADVHESVAALADREQSCCRFLTIDVQGGDVTTLSISSDEPAARPVVEALAAVLTGV